MIKIKPWSKAQCRQENYNAFCIKGNRIFAGTDIGICYSDDMGASWTLLPSSPRYCVAMCVSGNNLIAACNKHINAHNDIDNSGGQIYYSSDNGETWSIGYTAIAKYTVLCISGNRILVGAQDAAICYSDDNGISWNGCQTNATGICASICVKGERIFASCRSTLYYSDNNGTSWRKKQLPQGSSISAIGRLCVHNNRIFTLAAAPGVPSIPCYSDDDGETWTQINFPANRICRDFYVKDNYIFIITNDSNNSYLRYIYYSNDDGETWAQLNVPESTTESAPNKAAWNIMYIVNERIFIAYYLNWSAGYIYYTDKQDTKYLDQNGVQEIITQFKAYCDAKVGA
jgi:photosystem II stability/assembly factor-like uncharacterized protein